MKIILSGYMGSGKTGVGKLLAHRIQLPFLDLDVLISSAENRSITEIFEYSGEIYFRKKESELLSKKVNSEEDFILALGGGTPCYGNNLETLQKNPDVILIYLKTSINELKKRLLPEIEHRPLISHLKSEKLLEDFIGKHLFERSFYYSQSQIIISTDGKTLEDISEEIAQKLQ